MKAIRFIALFIWVCIANTTFGQITHPKASPFSRIEQAIGLSNITIEYSRPAVRGRKLFGELVPYGRIWRVGANESTKITVDSEVEVMGNVLPKGTYALYAFPAADSWEIVFHKNITHWGDGRKAYNQEEDAFRITLKPEIISVWHENFLISFDEITHNSATMQWIWGNTRISIPLSVNTHQMMHNEIAIKIKENPSAQTYYEAGRYLQEQEIDYLLALEYLNKAILLGGDTYYFHRVKSLVQAALKDYTGAIESAERSLVLAQAEEKDEFVRMNKRNIRKWEKLK